MPTTNQAIQQAQATRDAISQDTPRTTRPVLAALFRTIIPPLFTFLVTMVASGYVRVYFSAQFQDDSLDLMTAISTSLLVLALTWWVFKRADRRFGGVAAFRGLARVVGGVRGLELMTEAVKTEQAAPDDLATAARQTWEIYTQFVASLGLSPPARKP